jgi:hypothetical protein
VVVTADGDELGRVKEVSESAFLVNAPRQFDYWLESSLAKEATAARVDLTISQRDVGAYKMDRPQDHNEFMANVPDSADPANVRGSVLGRGGLR